MAITTNTMENTIIKACAYVQKIIEAGINKSLYKFHVICLSPGLYHCSILNTILIYNLKKKKSWQNIKYNTYNKCFK